MNWAFETTAAQLAAAEPNVELADGEEAAPDPVLVEAARDVGATIAEALGGADEYSVTVHAHETLQGSGFRPGHVSVVVSRLDPARGGA